jgi:chemotaxis protein CheX
MQVELINPFISSLNNAFMTMLDCPIRRGEISLKEGRTPMYEISGIIGLSGKAVGTVVLSLSTPVALQAASTMLLCETTEVNADVVDAVGELTNMVAGGAKAQLAQYDLSVSLPNVITGRNHEIRFPSNVTPICMPFTTKWGALMLEVGLVPVEAAVGA